ncbi:hypothetical protein WR25_04661 [Diploscapter pachys]|uniref:Uncharacterized protein n=1 Tax=Diploscapter pachys TaxID=2018661 RepID=A0A2A2KHU5_9BILA|nr:hypothetical protein WR25_04661 [Diploscapter pachys]
MASSHSNDDIKRLQYSVDVLELRLKRLCHLKEFTERVESLDKEIDGMFERLNSRVDVLLQLIVARRRQLGGRQTQLVGRRSRSGKRRTAKGKGNGGELAQPQVRANVTPLHGCVDIVAFILRTLRDLERARRGLEILSTMPFVSATLGANKLHAELTKYAATLKTVIDDYVTYADSREVSLYLQRPGPGLSSSESNEHNDPLPVLAFKSQPNGQQQLNILR